MDTTPDPALTTNVEPPDATLPNNQFNELSSDELALFENMPARPPKLPIWTLEEFGYTYVAPHVHPNGRIETGLYPPEYYEYDELQPCSWEEGLQSIESFDWSGAGEAEPMQGVQSSSLTATGVSVHRGVTSCHAENDESNIRLDVLPVSAQPENERSASLTSAPEPELEPKPVRADDSILAPSSQPWIPSPPSLTPQQLQLTLPSARKGNQAEAAGIATGLSLTFSRSPASEQDTVNLVEPHEHTSTDTDTQSIAPVAAVLPSECNVGDVVATTDSDGHRLEGASSTGNIASSLPSWNGVTPRGNIDPLTVFPLPQTRSIFNLGQASTLTASFDAHDAMLLLAKASAPYYIDQPSAQSTPQHVPTQVVGESEMVLPGDITRENASNDPSLTQLPMSVFAHPSPDENGDFLSVKIDNQYRLQSQLEETASDRSSHESLTPVPTTPHKHEDTVNQHSLVSPLAAVSLSSPTFKRLEGQLAVSPELPALPFHPSSTTPSSVNSRAGFDANSSPDKHGLGQERDMQANMNVNPAPSTVARETTPLLTSIDTTAPTQDLSSFPTDRSRASASRKRAKAAKTADDVSSTEEDTPAKKKPKRSSRIQLHARSTTNEATDPTDPSSNGSVEQNQLSPSSPDKADIDDVQTPQTARQLTFSMPNYTADPTRTPATAPAYGTVYREPFSRSPGFHRARSEDVAMQEGHLSDAERSVSPTSQSPSAKATSHSQTGSSREEGNRYDDLQPATEAAQEDEALVPGSHVKLHIQMQEAKEDRKAAEVQVAVKESIETSHLVDESGADEVLASATPSLRASLVPQKRPRATTKPARSRKKASIRIAALEDESATSGSEANLFPPAILSTPAPPPPPTRAPGTTKQKSNKKPRPAPATAAHPLYPGYGKRTTRGDSRAAKDFTVTYVTDKEGEEDGDGEDDAAYESALENEASSAEEKVGKAAKSKTRPSARKPAKQPKTEMKSANVSAATPETSTPSTPTSTPHAKNKWGFKTTPTRARTAATAKGRGRPKGRGKKDATPAPTPAPVPVPAQEAESGARRRQQTRQASRAASEKREVEERATNLKLRLRSTDGTCGGK